MSRNDLNQAKTGNKNEFYTLLPDIEKELKYYKQNFKGKIVYCNCDDPFESNFFKYFALNFKSLGLKKLICTSYAGSPIVCEQLSLFGEGEKIETRPKTAWKIEITETPEAPDGSFDLANKVFLSMLLNKAKKMKGDGDFRSDESIKLLKQADIVVTNPPFALFREYVAQLMKFNKKFIILGNMNAITYKEIFPLIKNNKIWWGCSIHSGDREFAVPDSYPLNASGFRVDEKGKKFIRVKGVRWYTNIDHFERHEPLDLFKEYKNHSDLYVKYFDYDAINVDETIDIPCDYFGVIGVPITFFDKYNPDQFEILDCHEPAISLEVLKTMPKFKEFKSRQKIINGVLCQKKYHRLFIKRKTKE